MIFGKSAAPGPSTGKLNSRPFSASVTTRLKRPDGSKVQFVRLAPGAVMTKSERPPQHGGASLLRRASFVVIDQQSFCRHHLVSTASAGFPWIVKPVSPLALW